MGRAKSYLPAVAVLIGAILRLAGLDHIPPGLYYDESADGVDALRVLAGIHPVFFTGNQGREPLLIYMEAASSLLLGPTPLALHIPMAAVGILTVAATYSCFRALFGKSVAVIGAFLLAVSFWHVSLSRLALRPVGLPLFIAIAGYALWSGINRQSLRHFALGGLALGLSLYTYIPSRLGPVLFALWLGGIMIVRLSRHDRSWRRIALGSGLAAGTLTVTFFPLGYYFASHPNEFFGRIRTEAAVGQVGTILHGFSQALIAVVWSGDPNPRQDLPGLPLVALPLGVLAIYGIIVGLRSRPRETCFVLSWCAAMLAPAALSLQPAHALRLVGELPYVLALPAIAIDALQKQRIGRVKIGSILGVAVILFVGITSAWNYFVVWAPRPDTATAFQADLWSSLQLLHDVPPDTEAFATANVYQGEAIPWLFSAYARTRSHAFDGTRDFVLPSPQPAETPNAASDNAGTSRVTKASLTLLNGPTGTSSYQPDVDYVYAASQVPDFRSFLDVTPSLIATSVNNQGVVTGKLFRLPLSTELPVPAHSADAWLGTAIHLIGTNGPSVVAPGQTARVTVYWTVNGHLPDGNWQFFCQLVDRQQHRILAQDYNEGFPPSQWQNGDRVMTWFNLPIPANAPAVVADVNVGMFDRNTGQRLALVDSSGRPSGTALIVGPVRIDRSPVISPPVHLLGDTFNGSIDLVGFTLSRTPHDTVTVNLVWRATRPVKHDYTVFIHALNQNGQLVAQDDSQPQHGDFPTSTWKVGELIPDSHQLRFIAKRAEATNLEIGLYLLATGQRLRVVAPGRSGRSNAIVVPLSR